MKTTDAIFHRQMARHIMPKTKLTWDQVMMCRCGHFNTKQLHRLFGVTPQEVFMAKHGIGPYEDFH